MTVSDIISFMKDFPLLENFKQTTVKKIFVDNLNQYAIQINPTDPTIKTYIDGSRLKQCSFDFLSKEEMDVDTDENIDNNDFYIELVDWLNEKTLDKELPDVWRNIHATNSGFLQDYTTSENTGIYSITINIEYVQ